MCWWRWSWICRYNLCWGDSVTQSASPGRVIVCWFWTSLTHFKCDGTVAGRSVREIHCRFLCGRYICRYMYSVFFFICPQEVGCCELVFELLRSPMASMSPQDQAQITFRSETHYKYLYYCSGRRLSQGRTWGFVNLSTIYSRSQEWFLLLPFNFEF